MQLRVKITQIFKAFTPKWLFSKRDLDKSKWKIVVTGLAVVVLAVFAALLHRQHVVFSQSDGSSEEVATNNYLRDYWWQTVVKEANEELSRIRQISDATSFQSPQTVEALMEAYDASFETKIASETINFGDIDLTEVDQAYPRAEFLQMLLDKGILIENATEYYSFLMYRFNLLSFKQSYFEKPLSGHDADYKDIVLERMGLPMNASPVEFEETSIQHYLEMHYYVKEALKDPTFAQQWNEGKFVTIARSKDGTRFPLRADTTYYELNSDGSIGELYFPAMGESFDVSAIQEHLHTPFPFTKKLPKHVKIGFIGPDGKPADAPRRGLAKLWGGFADIFDDDGPEITRSESEAAPSSEAELQPPAYASEPKPVSRTSPWSSVADSPAHDSTPRTAPRHAVPELEMSEFPADWERPDSASINPSEIENQMKQVEDWKLPGGVEAEELERLLESLEDIDDPTSIPNAPDEREILREDERYKDRGNPNGNRDESYEEQDESERERREAPEKEP